MASAPSQSHQVTIFKHGGMVKVWPPCVVVRAGDSVVFTTIGTSATIVFPHAKAFVGGSCPELEEASAGGEAIIRVKQNTAARVYTQSKLSDMGLAELRERLGDVAVTQGNDQIYAYSVYCGEFNDHGQGQSSPVMLIEPPDKPPPP